jgi:hypothetical protein
LWGTRVSPSTVSELNKKIYGKTARFAPHQSFSRAATMSSLAWIALSMAAISRTFGSKRRG